MRRRPSEEALRVRDGITGPGDGVCLEPWRREVEQARLAAARDPDAIEGQHWQRSVRRRGLHLAREVREPMLHDAPRLRGRAHVQQRRSVRSLVGVPRLIAGSPAVDPTQTTGASQACAQSADGRLARRQPVNPHMPSERGIETEDHDAARSFPEHTGGRVRPDGAFRNPDRQRKRRIGGRLDHLPALAARRGGDTRSGCQVVPRGEPIAPPHGREHRGRAGRRRPSRAPPPASLPPKALRSLQPRPRRPSARSRSSTAARTPSRAASPCGSRLVLPISRRPRGHRPVCRATSPTALPAGRSRGR